MSSFESSPSEQEQPPSLTDYPGYFPPSKPPFWTRTKVGTALGILGLVVGLNLGGSSGSSPVKTSPPVAKTGFTQAQVDQSVSDATAKLRDRLDSQKTTLLGRLSAQQAKAQTAKHKAVAAAVARTHAADRAKQAAAVTAAVAAAKAQAQRAAAQASTSTGSTPGTSSGTSSSGGGLDPRFSYCYQANAAGYGPYVQGQDPEYYWYEDADGDGIDCEP